MENYFNKNQLGLNIKYLREKKKLTQAALGQILGKNNTTLSNWEIGLALPELEIIVSISKHFGISLDSLVLIPHDNWGQQDYISKTLVCENCEQKDITIMGMKEDISSLKDYIRLLKDKGNSKNEDIRQTA
ncbi:MAG: helix-turn-helix domain-containing protein [Bacteroidales bacterium]